MFTHFFIDRPIFASVISLVIVIAGAVAMFNLPIAPWVFGVVAPSGQPASLSVPQLAGTVSLVLDSVHVRRTS